MGRFVLLILALTGISATAVLGACVVGSPAPGPQTAVMGIFSNPDGTPCRVPCLLGIRPGETRFDQAIVLIQTHPMTSNLNPVNRGRFYSFEGPGMTLALFKATGSETEVGGIIWGLYPESGEPHSPDGRPSLDALRLGDLFAALGPPQDIQLRRWERGVIPLYRYYDGRFLVNPRDGLSPLLSKTRLASDSRVLRLLLWAPGEHWDWEDPRAFRWAGFSGLVRYLMAGASIEAP